VTVGAAVALSPARQIVVDRLRLLRLLRFFRFLALPVAITHKKTPFPSELRERATAYPP